MRFVCGSRWNNMNNMIANPIKFNGYHGVGEGAMLWRLMCGEGGAACRRMPCVSLHLPCSSVPCSSVPASLH